MKKIIIANWKMCGDRQFIQEYFKQFHQKKWQSCVVFCPPFPYLAAVKNLLKESVALGAQDCHEREKGAYTGNVSAAMLADLACSYVILGHSERRQYHGEKNELVQEKAKMAFSHRIIPVICVGENLTQRESGKAVETVLQQIEESLPEKIEELIIAYEPVWAIGTGKTPSLEDIKFMHKSIRSFFENKYEQGAAIPLLYGGSVNEENAEKIMSIPHVNGVLVGGASLNPNVFLKIIAE